ncbi:MAG: diguanylate cyclase [Candidatus Thiodiazotropha sp.]
MTDNNNNALLKRIQELEEEVAELQTQLQSSESQRSLLTFVLDSIPDYVAYVDQGLYYRFCNQVYADESGQSLDTFIGKHVIQYIGQNGMEKIQPYVKGVLSGHTISYNDRIDYRFKQQQDVEVFYKPDMASDQSVKGFSVYVRNVTAQRRGEEMLRRQALYDPLTKIPNRVLFNKRLEQAISRATRNSGRLAILFIDLDGFKQVNDEMGHEVGDQVLHDVAQTFVKHLRGDDTLARIGGDEFVLLVEDVQGDDAVFKLADKLIGAVTVLKTPALDEVRIGCSIGISTFPDHAKNGSDLLTRADKGMYEAKRRGKNQYFIIGKN